MQKSSRQTLMVTYGTSSTPSDYFSDAGDSDTRAEERSVPGFVYRWRHLHARGGRGSESGSARKWRRQRLDISGHLLRDVSGEAHPGELLAIMGPNGAGKTTLLNALTFRTRLISGERLLNGRPLTEGRLNALSAYVKYEDVFVGTLTVREHLVFHAMLRIDRHTSYENKMRRVNQVISQFSLREVQNNVIGIPGRIKGLSGGELRRLAFASEVLRDPALMFCDEPTSGLDSFMALTVATSLKVMARQGKTVIITVHQPSSEMYALFDKVLLMAEGRLCFLGTKEEALQFFSSMGAKCPDGYNPADFFAQLLGVIPGREKDCRQSAELLCDAFSSTDAGKALSADDHSNQQLEESLCENTEETSRRRYEASWWTQFRIVLWRSWISVTKEPALIRMRFLQTVILSIMVGAIFFNQKLDEHGVMNINGAIVAFIINMSFQNVYAVITAFCSELPVFSREHLNGMYRVDVYFLSKTLAELPVFLAIPCLFSAVAYYMVGLNPAPIRFLLATAITALVSFVASSFGYFISCISSNTAIAMALAHPMVLPFLLYGGFFINVTSVPWALSWLTYLSWIRLGNEALFINQWSDVDDIDCTATNQTCPANGEVVLETYDFHEADLLYDVVGLVGLLIVFRLMALGALLIRTWRFSR